MFPVGDVRKDLPSKEMVLGIRVDGDAKAYPLKQLGKKSGVLEDNIGKHTVTIILSEDGQVVDVKDRQGKSIPTIFAYWFAWQAFHPATSVYTVLK